MTDKNIVRLLRLNLQTGFKILLKEYKEPIYWHIRRLTVNHEDAQNATQETFIRVYRSFGSYDSSRPLKAWLYRIATNEALRIIGRRHPAVDLDNCGEAMETLPTGILTSQMWRGSTSRKRSILFRSSRG